MHKWVRPLVALLILSVSMVLLSAVSDNLSPYLAMPGPEETGPPERRVPSAEDIRISPPSQMLTKPGHLIFVVSPADPVLYWRTTTADYYDGLEWYKTTREITTHEFPSSQKSDATQYFSVELNMTQEEVALPIPPGQIDLGQPVLFPSVNHEYYFDGTGDTYGVRALSMSQAATIVYQAGWHHTEIDKWRVSLDDISQEIRELYLQLPSLPAEVVQLAQDLKRRGMNVVDQVLSDVAYFLLHFEYDLDYYMGRTRRTISQDWVLSYLQWKKGLCLDAATALAVILRCQGIPSRLSLGYKPTWVDGNRVLYYSNTSHAETEAYLPPYGWVRFDATPFSPLDLPEEDFGALRPEKGLTLKISPIEAEGYQGERVFYHLTVNNCREVKDHFELSLNSTEGWGCEIIPESLSIGPFESCDALIEVGIPENVSYGKTNIVTVTATSAIDPSVEVSNTTITRVGEGKRESTTTSITYINDSVFRGDSFYVEGTVFTADNELVHNMSVLILLKGHKVAGGIVCGNGFSRYGVFRVEVEVPFDIEFGDYAVIALSLGTTQHASSSSEHSIEVAARTYIELDIRLEEMRITRPLLVGDHATLSGFLRLDNGTALSNANLGLEILTPGFQGVGKHEIVTNNGFFIKRFLFLIHGTYELNITFLGKGYIARSHSYRKIYVGSPLVQSLTEDYCVRGETLNINGNVSSNNRGTPQEPVTISFDGDALATVKTGGDGAFFYNLKIDPEEQPGRHLLACTLPKRKGIGVTQYISVMVEALITINAPEEVTGGEPFTCTVSLRDDHGFPIEGGEISVGNYGLSQRADTHGNIEFMLDTLPLWWDTMNLSVAFKGTETYLPSATSVIVSFQPGFGAILFALTTSALFIIGITIDRRKFRRFFYKRKSIEPEGEEISAPPEKEARQTKPSKTRALIIGFPDIGTRFPNVWGVKDILRIQCTPDRGPTTREKGNEIELFVNGKRIAKERLSKNRPASFSYVFDEKGEHKVGARLVRKSPRQPVKAETMLRIVDYREETIRLYKTFLQHLVHQGVNLKDNMTAREVERLLAGAGDSNPKSLQEVLNCFERAEYSDHEVSRGNYETMYLSIKELIGDVD